MTTMSRRGFLGAAGAAGLAWCAGACGSDDRRGPDRPGDRSLGTLSLQLNWIKDVSFVGDYLMVAEGLATTAGFSSTHLLPGGPSVAADPVVAAGRARFGYSAPDLLAAARAGGAKMKTIGVGYQHSPFTVLSLAADPLTEPAQLAGRTVAVDDVNRITMASFLAANGMAERDVHIVPANFDPSLLASGQVDAYLGYDSNEALSLALQGVELARIDFEDHELPGVGQVYVTTERLIAEHPDVVTAALRAFVGGWKAFFADVPAGLARAKAQFDADATTDGRYLDLAAGVFRGAYLGGDAPTLGLLNISLEHQQAVVDALGLGGIRSSPAELFDLSLLEALYADDPSLRALPGGT